MSVFYFVLFANIYLDWLATCLTHSLTHHLSHQFNKKRDFCVKISSFFMLVITEVLDKLLIVHTNYCFGINCQCWHLIQAVIIFSVMFYLYCLRWTIHLTYCNKNCFGSTNYWNVVQTVNDIIMSFFITGW